jgi:transcriptional regulator with PAS, ATPase and Fis domain
MPQMQLLMTQSRRLIDGALFCFILLLIYREGSFRQDLYCRLNVVKIGLPPLRERRKDIPLLVAHFIRRFNLLKERDIQRVDDKVLAFFMDYAFPGNVRELENIIAFAFIMCRGPVIEMAHLPDDLFQKPVTAHDEWSGPERTEAEKLRAMLCRHSGDRSKTARAMGISRTTLWRKIKKYGLDKDVDAT